MSNEKNIPLVSVVIPCYNQGIFLPDALENFENDPVKDFEIIIVNDGSEDAATLEILSGLETKGYHIIHQKNKGLSAARNTGIAAASAPYILPLDADNKIDTGYYRKAVAVMEREKGTGVVYSDCFLFGEKEDTRVTGAFSLTKLLAGNYIDACAVFRKKVWEDAGGYNTGLRFYEDWEFWLHAAANGWEFHYLPESLFYYRVRTGSMLSLALNPEKRAGVVKHLVQKYEELYRGNSDAVIADLHAILAGWELQQEQYRKKVRDEFHHHREVAENAFREEAKKLEAHFLSEQQKAVALSDQHVQNLQLNFEAQKKLREEHFHGEIQKLHEAFHQREIALQKTFTAEKERIDTLLAEAKEQVEQQKIYATHLQSLNVQYEGRIQSMENTRTWRLRKGYYKMRGLLKSPGRNKRRIPGLGFIRRIVFFLGRKGRKIVRRFFKKIFKVLYLWLEEIPVRIIPVNELVTSVATMDMYHQWMVKNFPREAEFRQYKKESEQFAYRPLISILLPVYNPPVEFFRQTLNSVIGQIYENWELCIADDASTDKRIRQIIEEYRERDFRIRVVYRETNGHISRASNSALELANGAYTLLLDHDDLLTQDCLYHVVKLVNEKKDTDLIYSDEDKIDENGNHSMPHFKPKWCPDNFLSRNYLGHVVVCRTSLLKEIGGFRVGYEGSQDYDMLLRFTERTDKIGHIPRVLYHWRIHAASAARSEEAKPYAYHAAQKALTESLLRRQEEAEVSFLAGFRGYSVRYKLFSPGKVSVIIPTKDNTDVLQTCIDSIFGRSTWKNFEIVVVSNNSTDKKLFRLLDQYVEQYPNQFRYFEQNIPFNFSKLMNVAAEHSSGEYLLLLNNDTEVITPDWMEAMMEQSQRKSVGAVGVKLLYPDDRIQHAGVIIGLGGIAGHTFVGQHKDAAGYFNYIQSINNYSALTAACLMVSRKKYEEVNGFDEQFEVEYNDVDFCLRLMEKGYNNVYLPHVEIYHYESLTRGHPHMSKESYDRHIRELGLFKERWQHIVEDDPCYSIHLTRGAHNFELAL